MFKSYFKITVRNLLKYKVFSFINISGLAVGMACCIVIFLFVQDELSYDRFHENANQIYRVANELTNIMTDTKQHSTITWSWMAPNMVNDFPEVLDAVRIDIFVNIVMSYRDKRFNEDPVYADASILDIFTFPLIRGDKTTALKEPNCAVITEALAEKFFSNEDPIGKILTIDSKHDFKITGILKNIPHNSHFRFDFLASYESLKSVIGVERYEARRLLHTYLLLDKNASPEELEKKFHNFVAKYRSEEFASGSKYYLQPLTSIHLNSHIAGELGKNSDITYSYIISGIAIMILIIACINFINLSTARASSRSKEVGMRKVVGATRLQLIRQFLGESIFISFIALLFAIIFVYLFLPFFNDIVGKQLTLDLSKTLILYIVLAGITVITGILSGGYPAVFISSFQPAEVLKGNLKRRTITGTIMRKGLVIFQFAISLVFIIGTLIILNQLNFMRNKELGFDKDYVISIPVNKDRTLGQRFEIIKSELLQNPNILGMTASRSLPGTLGGMGDFQFKFVPEGFTDDESIIMYILWVGYDFIDFFGIDVIDGRNFSSEIPTDIEEALILTESAVKKIGWKSVIGKRINCDWTMLKGTVIGVVKDFHTKSLHDEIPPSIFKLRTDSYYYFLIRISPNDIHGTIAYLEEKWRDYSPQLIFNYSFLDDKFSAFYREEERTSKVFKFATFLSVFLACLGLFGLASFSAERRFKEIGIRRALGATVPGIIILLSKDFTKLVIAANVIAWPIAYLIMDRWWLQNFAYKVNIGLWVFLLAGILRGH